MQHPSDSHEIFLTGATGFIGSGLLAKWLVTEPSTRINLLARSRRGERPESRIARVLGEIMPEADARELERRI
ncbi:MAG TPA: SDR family oxidoreductase, partial [bacterium]|nr:SDR family oxidoreductase [bacterium]